MHRHHLRLRLEAEVPLLFKSTTEASDPKWSLTLVEFLLTTHRAEWVIKLGNGELLEGRLNTPRPLPFWTESNIFLSYPVQASFVPKGTFRPEFLVKVPSHIITDKQTQTRGR